MSEPTQKITNRTELLEAIRELIDKEIQPFIKADGGEVRIIDLEEDGTLKVSMHGACHGCPGSTMTLQFGIQRAINSTFPEYDIIVTPVEEDEVETEGHKDEE